MRKVVVLNFLRVKADRVRDAMSRINPYYACINWLLFVVFSENLLIYCTIKQEHLMKSVMPNTGNGVDDFLPLVLAFLSSELSRYPG